MHQHQQEALDRSGNCVGDVGEVLRIHFEAQLAEDLLLHRQPVLDLLLLREGSDVVVEIHEVGKVEFENLRDADAVGEVARDIALGPRQRVLVHPCVDLVRLLVGEGFHVSCL